MSVQSKGYLRTQKHCGRKLRFSGLHIKWWKNTLFHYLFFPPGSVVHKLHSINCGANHAGISINLHRPEAGTQLAAWGLFFFFFRPWLAARWMKGTKERSSFAATEKGVRIQEMFPKCLSVNSWGMEFPGGWTVRLMRKTQAPPQRPRAPGLCSTHALGI